MDIEKVTLADIIAIPDIRRIEISGQLYLDYADLNRVFDDEFRYIPTILHTTGQLAKKYVHPAEIQEHLLHLKNMPSFGSQIDLLLNKGKNKR